MGLGGRINLVRQEMKGDNSDAGFFEFEQVKPANLGIDNFRVTTQDLSLLNENSIARLNLDLQRDYNLQMGYVDDE